MIYTVTFNPALDYVMELEKLSDEDINRTQRESIFYGGKGINVSVILSRLGIDTKALGFVAGFSGTQLESMLNDDNIKTDFIRLKNGFTRINVKIKADKNLDINARGPEISQDDIAALMKKLECLQSGDCLVLAGSIPADLPDDIYEKIAAGLSEREVDFAADATGELLVNVLKYKPLLIKPNHHELGDIFSVKIDSEEKVKQYAGKLREMGARNVLVSCGKRGAALLDENGNFYSMGNVPGKIKSSVGCGDSMLAGFLAGLCRKNDYAYAFRLGCVCGNATAFSDSLATAEELKQMENNKFFSDK